MKKSNKPVESMSILNYEISYNPVRSEFDKL